eukprot:CAMPEP_0113290212 /NCGR_PEP_ID=MMETSP0008_2-20120614/33312_1 /TAXON_ID=97485 /ORGANISM="Prymnesium parvum" /LENGTH=40 /DNA_ID=CAMNT_0000141877 /DNA_START=103 /DNA_END=225 /DNA_ORIENTATION=+ /assembly_acc=CAM_ASM_000153
MPGVAKSTHGPESLIMDLSNGWTRDSSNGLHDVDAACCWT